MMSYRLLKNQAGLLLIGDYTLLTWLHAVVHEINKDSPLIKDREGMFLGFAYDLRKAFEMQWELLKAPRHMPELGTRYGVNQLWPVLMVQQRMLRASLAFIPHSLKHQAIVYALEAVIEEALAEEFSDQHAARVARWRRIDPGQPGVSRSSTAAARCSAHGRRPNGGRTSSPCLRASIRCMRASIPCGRSTATAS